MEAKKKKKKTKTVAKKSIKKSSFLRSQTPKTTKTFDKGLPVNLLNFSELKIEKPIININSNQHLSPFVVSFAKEVPLAVDNSSLVELNFIVPEHEFVTNQKTEDFTLTQEDLQTQLLENECTPLGHQTFSLPLAPFLPSINKIRQAVLNFKNHVQIPEPEVETIDLNQINIPALQPLLLFDFPEIEEDENEESDILTWEDVIKSVTNQGNEVSAETVETKTNWLPNWNKIFTAFQKTFSFKIGYFETPAGWHRALATFVLVSFAFVLPLHAMETIHDLQGAKNNLTQTGTSAVSKLNEAVSLITTNSASAASSFQAAKKDFSQARLTIDDLGATASLILSVLPSTRSAYLSGDHLIAAGENLSWAGEKISQGLTGMQTDGLDTTGRLTILTETFKAILPALEEANNHLEKVDPTVLPVEYQERFIELQNLLPNFLVSTKDVTKFSQTLSALLGAEGKKRYLLLFQNNTEIRPTGGFLGSFAVLDISHGEITNLSIPEGGSYDLQGSLKNNLVAPLPLQLISARWEFQDANWFPDFPTSARQALDFYYDASNPTVDGVVAVNATFITALIDLLGPVEMNEYERTIDSENFLFETQKIVEFDYVNYENPESDRVEAAPKAFIGDLAEKLLTKVKDSDPGALLQILDLAQKGLSQKDIQLYFPNDEVQKAALELGWSGEVKQTDGDYLMVVNSNLGGGKTDLVIDEKIDLRVDIQANSRIVNTLKISRTHNGISGAMFTGVNNVDFLRVYVPRGSKMLSASGFTIPDVSLFERPGEDWLNDDDVLFFEENASVDPTSGTIISEEFGKTVFGNWVQTKPGETSVITVVYELPFAIKTETGFIQAVKNKIGLAAGDNYSLLVQKQSGIINRITNVSISTSENLQSLWTSNSDQNQFSNANDSFMNILFAK